MGGDEESDLSGADRHFEDTSIGRSMTPLGAARTNRRHMLGRCLRHVCVLRLLTYSKPIFKGK